MPMKLRFTLPVACYALSACSPSYEAHRETIKERLTDPASAEFKNEKLRTLWSKEGSRLSVYCAEVNANNQMGGKTGFKPVTLVLAQNDRDAIPMTYGNGKPKAGSIYFHDGINPDYYMQCVREDTERAENKIHRAYISMGRPWSDAYQAEIDRQEPVLSQDSAPK